MGVAVGVGVGGVQKSLSRKIPGVCVVLTVTLTLPGVIHLIPEFSTVECSNFPSSSSLHNIAVSYNFKGTGILAAK